MISSILVPTDFSDVANNALHFAIQLAKKTHAKIYVLHVNHMPIMDASFPAEVYQTFMLDIENNAKENIEKLKTNYLNNSGVKFETQIVMGFVNDEVQTFAPKNNIDLIVMGTTGASGLQEILIGSNAASVVAKSTIPVLIIPPSSTYHELKHIVYSSDFNEPEFPAVSQLVYFAELFNAQVSVLHVKTDYDRFFDAANNFFQKNKHNLSYEKWKIVKLEDGNVIEKINSFIETEHADMLVMAKHNRGFFDKLFHRSLSKQMAYHTKIPLLVLNK
jgi:nucleotide-binding universal stress UspA family protein